MLLLLEVKNRALAIKLSGVGKSDGCTRWKVLFGSEWFEFVALLLRKLSEEICVAGGDCVECSRGTTMSQGGGERELGEGLLPDRRQDTFDSAEL